jgi:hypothetical protein
VRAADDEARREFDAMRNATQAMPVDTVTPPPAVTPTDRRDAPGYARGNQPEPDDAPDDDTSGQVRDGHA